MKLAKHGSELEIENTHIDRVGKLTSWDGSGNVLCPHCGNSTDVGTGFHSIPDTAQCYKCEKFFAYRHTGRVEKRTKL